MEDEKVIRIHALDETGELIQKIDYISLIWTRLFNEPGEFQIEIKSDEYSPDMKLIYSPDRDEVGFIKKTDYVRKPEGKHMLIWGYFAEKELDNDVIYPVANLNGPVDQEVLRLFRTYSKQGFHWSPSALQIGEVAGNITTQITGDELSGKIYDLLADFDYTYSVSFSFYTKTFTFQVWQGSDLTTGQTENNPVYFSEKLKNITDSAHTYDESNYKNYAFVAGEGEGAERVIEIVDLRKNSTDPKKEIWIDARDLRHEDDMTLAQYKETLRQRGIEKMYDFEIINDFELNIDPNKEGRRYREDFNIGDKCTVFLDNGIEEDVLITGVEEVVKENHLEVTLTLGRQIKKLRRK